MAQECNSIPVLSWDELAKSAQKEPDRINGHTNPQSNLRLFGHPDNATRVTLYRDHHAWCPYCQKVWLWLEWMQIPYRIKKVTMRCYGQKEAWYLEKVPSGMLPAIELDNQLVTESDVILKCLENAFGHLGNPLDHPRTIKLRRLERKLFQAWCRWLCNPSLLPGQEEFRRKQFQAIAKEMEEELKIEDGPFFDQSNHHKTHPIPGTADVIFIPYVERMNASLAYYKGLNLREEHPLINRWLEALEQLEVYRGTQGDFHTHAHDLPPQMGGCWTDPNQDQKYLSKKIDSGQGLGKMETVWTSKPQTENANPKFHALARVIKHRQKILEVNPLGEKAFDQPLRAALTLLIKEQPCKPTANSALGLRYLKDRVSVPRDMSVLAARALRQALEETAALDGIQSGPPINTNNRFDQDPRPFLD